MIFDNAIPKKSNFKIKSRLAEAKNGFKKQKIKKLNKKKLFHKTSFS